jgi:hypothetical protein
MGSGCGGCSALILFAQRRQQPSELSHNYVLTAHPGNYVDRIANEIEISGCLFSVVQGISLQKRSSMLIAAGGVVLGWIWAPDVDTMANNISIAADEGNCQESPETGPETTVGTLPNEKDANGA